MVVVVVIVVVVCCFHTRKSFCVCLKVIACFVFVCLSALPTHARSADVSAVFAAAAAVVVVAVVVVLWS